MFVRTVSRRCRSARKATSKEDASDDYSTCEKIVRRLFLEVHNQGYSALAQELFASPRSLRHLQRCLALLRRAAPACRFSVDEIVSLGDKVITRWTADVLLGGRPMQASGLAVFHFLDGKIIGWWQNWDELRILMTTS